MDKIDLFSPHKSKNLEKYVLEALRSGYWGDGQTVKLLENRLQEYLGKRPAVVNSGTSALHLALLAAGIKNGDEVIIPAQTFIATGLAVLYVNAKPVFADIDYNGNIQPFDIIEKITNKTKAIIPVHWGGYPCDMNDIYKIAKYYNLKVIEDAAHGFGSVYQGKKIGTLESDFTCFSFQATKILPSNDGGAIISNWPLDKVYEQRWFGINKEKSPPDITGERVYDLLESGYKYNSNNINAAIILAGLEEIDNILETRRSVVEFYENAFQDMSEVIHFKTTPDRQSSNWLFTFLTKRRNDFIRRMNEYGIPASVVHLGIDRLNIFGGKQKNLSNQRIYDEQHVCLPVHTNLTQEQLEYIVAKVKEGW